MKLSVIIPSIGRNTLDLVLLALEKQAVYEVLVCVSGLPRQRLDLLTNKFPFVRFLWEKDIISASMARNKALKEASGTHIAFLGDDTVPKPDWHSKIVKTYAENNTTGNTMVLLGYTGWPADLQDDDFHKWLLTGVQFGFPQENGVISAEKAWKYFYTSNIVVPTSVLGDLLFHEGFSGWGFEDIELGYRVFSKNTENIRLFYDKKVVVSHHHKHTLADVLKKTKASRKNARFFEQLHPEVNILPKGLKLLVLRGVLLKLQIIICIFGNTCLPKRVFWWYCWKSTWIGK